VDQPVRFTWHGFRNLLEGGESGDSLNRAPGGRAPPQYVGLSPGSLGIAVRSPALSAVAPSVPAGRRAVRCLTHTGTLAGTYRSL
jgi:hypothetical protein